MSQAIKIDKKIIAWNVVKNEDVAQEPAEPEASQFVVMNEAIKRPEMLMGSTYKIKQPQFDNSLYVTINDIVLNEGTKEESRHPYEIFLNSKSMEHYQWVVALTRVISACFRKGGDVAFLVDELISVYDPNGGYYKKGKYMPSIVAEIGHVIKRHMEAIGIIQNEEIDSVAAEIIKQKRELYEQQQQTQSESDTSDFPASATLCSKCHEKAVVVLDGCQTCLSCGDGKCS